MLLFQMLLLQTIKKQMHPLNSNSNSVVLEMEMACVEQTTESESQDVAVPSM